MEDLKQLIAAWVRQARKHADLSQEELGAKLAFDLGGDRGFTKANVSHWETRKHQPSIQQLLAIAKVTGHLLPPSISASMHQAGSKDQGSALGSEQGERSGNAAGAQAEVTAPAITLQWITNQEADLLSEFRASKEAEKQFILSTARRTEKVKSIAVARDKTQAK